MPGHHLKGCPGRCFIKASFTSCLIQFSRYARHLPLVKKKMSGYCIFSLHNPLPVFSYKLRYIVGFGLDEMAISTNPKPTIIVTRTRIQAQNCGAVFSIFFQSFQVNLLSVKWENNIVLRRSLHAVIIKLSYRNKAGNRKFTPLLSCLAKLLFKGYFLWSFSVQYLMSQWQFVMVHSK